MLGKRPRPPMKRTTSMSEITFDLNTVTTEEDPNNNNNLFNRHGPGVGPYGPYPPTSPGINGSDHSRVMSMVSPRNLRRNSADMTHNPDFLRSCFLCKRRLVPGRDIYMYKYNLSLLLFFASKSLGRNLYILSLVPDQASLIPDVENYKFKLVP